MTTAVAPVARKDIVCTYKYSGGLAETKAKGMREITDPDDPRWEDELMKPPFNGTPQGYLEVEEITRVDGEIVKRRGICGYSYHKNKAREWMYAFVQRQKEGEERPWDVEQHYRIAAAELEKAKNEGRLSDLKLMAEMIQTATRNRPVGDEEKTLIPATTPAKGAK